MLTPCEILRSKMGDLFECSQHDRLIRIRTPFLYPDGDIIDLFLSAPDLPTDVVSVHEGSYVLTDLRRNSAMVAWSDHDTKTLSSTTPDHRGRVSEPCNQAG